MKLNLPDSTIATALSISGQTGLLSVSGLASTNRIKTVRDAADTILELGGNYTPTGTWTNLTLVTPALGTPSALVLTNATGTASININGTVGATTPTTGAFTSETFTLSLKSTTALATPSALSATQFTGFASTVSGASLMGFGATNDVSLMNRAGTVVLGVGPNTTVVNVPGSLTLGTALAAAQGGTGQTSLTSLPLTTPQITTGINDANGNSMLAFTATASAVDGFTFTNAATANPATVTMAATGSDTNIHLQLTPKGTGSIIVGRDGLVATPAIRGSDTDSGIWFSGNNIRFSVDGQNAMQTAGGGIPVRIQSGGYGITNSTDASGTVEVCYGRNTTSVGEVTNGTSGQWVPLKLGNRDSGTTTVTNGLTIGHQSTGTPAAGLGSGILFNINSSTTADQNAAQIAALWTDATHATRTADTVFYNVNSAAALAETFRVKATGAVSQVGKTTTYNNIATVSNGVPSEVATIDSTGLTANVGASTLYAVPASGAGLYRVSAYLVTTTAASVSSTMPNAQVVYTDSDSNTSVTLDVSPILGAAGLGQSGLLTANAVGTVFSGTTEIYVKASTTIQYQTVNYASTAGGMAYALRMKLEAL